MERCVALRLLGLLDAAEGAARGEARFRGRQALADEIVFDLTQVGGHFARQLALGAVGTQERQQAHEESAGFRHDDDLTYQDAPTISLFTSPDSLRQRSTCSPSARQAGLRDGVVLRLAIALGPLPRALDPPLLLEADQGGVQRALIQRERIVRHLLEAGGEPVGMLRPHGRQGAQDDEIERALQQLHAFTGHRSEA